MSTRNVGRKISMHFKQKGKNGPTDKRWFTQKKEFRKTRCVRLLQPGPGEGSIKCEDWEQPGDQTMSIVLRVRVVSQASPKLRGTITLTALCFDSGLTKQPSGE